MQYQATRQKVNTCAVTQGDPETSGVARSNPARAGLDFSLLLSLHLRRSPLDKAKKVKAKYLNKAIIKRDCHKNPHPKSPADFFATTTNTIKT